MDSIGHRLRELRLERGLGQADVAKRLAISPAYLNLIEKGKRNVQLPLLWKALELFDVELESFMSSLGESRIDEGLAKLIDEPLLRTLNLDEEALQSLSAEPRAITTITALFHLYKNTRSQLDNLLATLARDEQAKKTEKSVVASGDVKESSLRFDYTPLDEVTDFLQANRNYFPVLEEAAAAVRKDFKLERRVRFEQLVVVLRDRLGITVDVSEELGGSSVVRRYDPERRLLQIAPSLTEQRRKFDLSHFIGLRLLEDARLSETVGANFRPKHVETPRLIRIHLANYFAGALLLPYQEFFTEVQRTRYDVELLASMFEMSYEAVAHRTCNLADPRRKGLPMHFLRCDIGGNISKRYTATGLHFPNGTGSCPKWAVHMAYMTPSVITKQYSVMPDGSRYFCFAKVTPQPISGSLVRGTVYSIGLGTHADAAKHLAYADDVPFTDASKMAIPVGVSCRLCERTDCNQRAAPSYKFAFSLDEHVKKDNFFSPLLERESKQIVPASRLAKRR